MPPSITPVALLVMSSTESNVSMAPPLPPSNASTAISSVIGTRVTPLGRVTGPLTPPRIVPLLTHVPVPPPPSPSPQVRGSFFPFFNCPHFACPRLPHPQSLT